MTANKIHLDEDWVSNISGSVIFLVSGERQIFERVIENVLFTVALFYLWGYCKINAQMCNIVV